MRRRGGREGVTDAFTRGSSGLGSAYTSTERKPRKGVTLPECGGILGRGHSPTKKIWGPEWQYGANEALTAGLCPGVSGELWEGLSGRALFFASCPAVNAIFMRKKKHGGFRGAYCPVRCFFMYWVGQKVHLLFSIK